ncbi:MAG: methyltransferase domain-containing protein [Clostridia bacterium]|nr:methyltransferase domain-containing protein [Clostridia bacterium]MCI2000111.1 methyltransferase domain-containing protein [Clostridia bacterium]MCI2014724.1 methyltransferase domain-containing protein [Clostridia bacterium]
MDSEIKLIADTWDKISPEFDDMHNTEDLKLWKQNLKMLLGDNKEMSILDIGTGTGFLAIMLSEMGYKSTGVDISEKMLKIAKEKSEKMKLGCKFLLFDGKELPFKESSFNAIVNCRLLWTLTEPENTFKDWYSVLKTNGKVLSFMRLAEDNDSNKNWCYGEDFEENLPLKFAEEKDFIKIFEKSGFKDVKIIHLPAKMSSAPLNPWFCVYCEK